MLIDLRQIKGGNDLKTAVDNLQKSYSASKVIMDGSQESVKAAIDKINTGLAAKAEKAYVDTELGKKADKSALGTASAKNVGNAEGNIPVLAAGGKLDVAVLPSIAINETFVVADRDAALKQTAEVGDVIIINDEKGAVKETLIVVKADGASFDEKFRPLYTSAESVSKAELNTALEGKADKTQVAEDIKTAKDEVTNKITEVSNKVTANETEINKVKESVTNISKTSGVPVLDKFTATKDGEVGFVLTATPKADCPVSLYVNGIKYLKGTDFDTEVVAEDGELKGKTKAVWKNVDFNIATGFIIMVEYSK